MFLFIFSYIICLALFTFLYDKKQEELKKAIKYNMVINFLFSILIFILVEILVLFLIKNYYLDKENIYLFYSLTALRLLNVVAFFEVFIHIYKNYIKYSEYLMTFITAILAFLILVVGKVIEYKINLNNSFYQNMYIIVMIIYLVLILFVDNLQNLKEANKEAYLNDDIDYEDKNISKNKYTEKRIKELEEEINRLENIAVKMEDNQEEYTINDDEDIDNLDDYYY